LQIDIGRRQHFRRDGLKNRFGTKAWNNRNAVLITDHKISG
jgi:hypothetical protein